MCTRAQGGRRGLSGQHLAKPHMFWPKDTRSKSFYLFSEQVLLTGCCLALGFLTRSDSFWGSFEKTGAHAGYLEWQVWLSSGLITESPKRERHLHHCTFAWCCKGTELLVPPSALTAPPPWGLHCCIAKHPQPCEGLWNGLRRLLVHQKLKKLHNINIHQH